MSTRLRSKLIKISSDDATSGDLINGFRVDLNEQADLHRIKACNVVSCVFSNTHYNINSSNNVFVYLLAGVETTATFPVGQYTISTLIDEFGIQAPALTVVIGETSFKLTFTAADFQLFSIVDKPTSTLSPFLGVTESSAVNVSTFTLQSVPELNGLDILVINSSKLAQANCVTSNNEQLDIFTIIPVTTAFGNNMVYHSGLTSEADSTILFDQPRNLQHVDIRLSNEKGKPVYLQGSFNLYLKFYF